MVEEITHQEESATSQQQQEQPEQQEQPHPEQENVSDQVEWLQMTEGLSNHVQEALIVAEENVDDCDDIPCTQPGFYPQQDVVDPTEDAAEGGNATVAANQLEGEGEAKQLEGPTTLFIEDSALATQAYLPAPEEEEKAWPSTTGELDSLLMPPPPLKSSRRKPTAGLPPLPAPAIEVEATQCYSPFGEIQPPEVEVTQRYEQLVEMQDEEPPATQQYQPDWSAAAKDDVDMATQPHPPFFGSAEYDGELSMITAEQVLDVPDSDGERSPAKRAPRGQRRAAKKNSRTSEPAKQLAAGPDHDPEAVLSYTGKLAKTEYVTLRCKRLSGWKLGDSLDRFQYLGLRGERRRYSLRDLKYDLSSGRMKLVSKLQADVEPPAAPSTPAAPSAAKRKAAGASTTNAPAASGSTPKAAQSIQQALLAATRRSVAQTPPRRSQLTKRRLRGKQAPPPWACALQLDLGGEMLTVLSSPESSPKRPCDAKRGGSALEACRLGKTPATL
mmetsp:Transcript_35272/g.64519  ORF Transcript_35272/g.64519 Transcript_35272/m.64519 type:complete len:499 (-) Transcript_35272:116-1612(-)